MNIDYMKEYTDLRTGKVSFNDFMEILNVAYKMGRCAAKKEEKKALIETLSEVKVTDKH